MPRNAHAAGAKQGSDSVVATVVCDLRLTAKQYEAAYSGTAKFVQAYARDGRSVRFPIFALQKFVTVDGIAGSFAFDLAEGARLVGVRRC